MNEIARETPPPEEVNIVSQAELAMESTSIGQSPSAFGMSLVHGEVR